MAYHNNPRIVTDGLVLCLDANAKRSYPGTGSTWYNLVDSTYDFTNSGATYNSAGYFDFDGTNDKMTSSIVQYSTTDDWTHEVVLDPGSSGIATSWNGIFGSGLYQGGYWFFHSGQLAFYQTYINPTTYLWYTGLDLGTDIPYDTITHLAMTHDGAGGLKVFVTGVQQRSTTFTFGGSYSAGIDQVGSGDGSRYGTSNIYLFRHYNRLLSSTELLQNYEAHKSRFGL